MGLQTVKEAGCLTLSLLLLSGGPFSSHTEMCRAEAQVKARAQMFVKTPVLELDCPLSLLGGNSYTELLVELRTSEPLVNLLTCLISLSTCVFFQKEHISF